MPDELRAFMTAMSETPQISSYELGSRIGRGAGATISLAYERTTRQPVAIKHVVRHTPDDERFIIQAENEYNVARRMDHPFLRKCYDLIRVRRWLKTARAVPDHGIRGRRAAGGPLPGAPG